ncbi:MAG: Gfo/Idh/MocA family oxidoreductase [Candidatus Sumerlaeia bacterium]|nr:Gfo/Idh/MocA family oxidoreductase [Candidatus Sumerlaeia bacterium]
MQRRERQTVLQRRKFLWALGAGAAAAAASRPDARAAAFKTTYRAAVIGHTGRGDYGHSLDLAWRGLPNVELVAVADADEKGLAAALKRLGVEKGYADYRRMLDEVKPDLVSIAPRWLDQHRDMVVAAAERGVRGVYLEKPMCRTLAEADEMVAVCRKHNVKLAIAHQTRYSPIARVVGDLLKAGAIGQVLEFRGRGKEDRRGGGEDLWVLGTHVLDLVHLFGGKPQWCFGSVYENGRPIRRQDVKAGAEGIGPLAGDTVHAMYRLDGGAAAYFDSVRNAGTGGSRFGLQIFGSTGIIEMTTGHLPPAFILEGDPAWSPGRSGKNWIPITSAGIGKPEPLKDGGLPAGNTLAVQDLIAAIEEDRPPKADIETGRIAIEMIVAVFESQRLGKLAIFPLQNRANPLAMLE